MKLLITVFTMALALGCSTKKSSDKRDDSGSAGHGSGEATPGAKKTPTDTTVLLETFLKMEPLSEGHMMADIMNSNREFRPDSGLGFWDTVGFSWTTENPETTTFKDKDLTVNFVTTSGEATQCRLDNGKWEDCSSSFSVKAVTEGVHEIHVRSMVSKITVGAFRFATDYTPPTVFRVTDTVTGNLLVMGNETLSSIECLSDQEVIDCKGGEPSNAVTGEISVTAKDLAGNSTTIDL